MRRSSRRTRSSTHASDNAPADLALLEECLIPLINATPSFRRANFRVRECGQLACTCKALSIALRREDVWMHLLFRDFPSSSALPAAVFQSDEGRGYQWHYMQRCEMVPEDEALAELPPPTLKPSDLVLLVDVFFGQERLISKAVQGADMVEILRTGSICLPVPEGTWTRDVELPFDIDRGCWGGWGLEFNDVDEDRVKVVVEYWKWSASIHLYRLTDFKITCLFDTNNRQYAGRGAWSERGEAMGRAWKSTPNTFAEEQPFDRSVDLIEGGCFEIHGINAMLPMEEEQMSGLVHAHMKGEDTVGIDFIVSPSFKLPPSPRSFVYEQLLSDNYTFRCENDSNHYMNQLRHHLACRWEQEMEDEVKYKAALDAGLPDNWRSFEDFRDHVVENDGLTPDPVSGQLSMTELRLSFGRCLPDDGGARTEIWDAEPRPDHDFDYLLVHMIENLKWK